MKAWHHAVLQALGAATLCLAFMIGPLVSPGHLLIYHLDGHPSSIFGPAVVHLCLLWFVFWILLGPAAASARMRFLAWTAIIFLFPWILVQNGARLGSWDAPGWMSLLAFLLPCVLFALAPYLCRSSHRSVFAAVQSFAATVLEFSAVLGFAAFLEVAWCAYQARGLNQTAVPSQPRRISLQDGAKRTRLIWIVFDELSYQQIYGQRFPGVKLPAFDRLAAGATVLTHVHPAGISTERIIPALLTGLPVDRLRVSAGGMLRALHNPDNGAWQPFDPRQTVFQDALDRGYRTGVAGWYNPYCRILAQVLDQCASAYRAIFRGGMISDGSLPSNLLYAYRELPDKLRSAFPRLLGGSAMPILPHAALDAQLHIDDYRALVSAADRLLADSSVNFVLLHLPVPHPRGIYDRSSMQFTTGASSYLDNLVLADQCLAHVRDLLSQQGEWDSSAVVVMGDHSWRTTQIWANAAGWTREEQEASHGGQFDDRPAYIVKMPGQHAPLRIDLPFAALRTRALLDGILQDRLRTPEELQNWVSQPAPRGSFPSVLAAAR